MFLNGLKQKSIVRKIKKEAAAHTFQSVRPITTIGIVQRHSRGLSAMGLEQLAEAFSISKHKITILNYTENSKLVGDDVFSSQHIGWRGVIKHPNLLTFCNTPFDLLVGLYDEVDEALALVAASAHAQIKAGLQIDGYGIYDLVVATSVANEDVLVEELNKYVEKING